MARNDVYRKSTRVPSWCQEVTATMDQLTTSPSCRGIDTVAGFRCNQLGMQFDCVAETGGIILIMYFVSI
eukprot:m.181340 g.181340  ORF g.181340 m.181340 type:complete len:70 (+) comp32059_c0_seq1:1035-1244(+)